MVDMALELGIEKLQARTNRLERLMEGLVVEQSGNDRTFREVISDNAELARRIEKLVEVQDEITALGKKLQAFKEIALLAREENARIARRTRELAERVERLERLLERED